MTDILKSVLFYVLMLAAFALMIFTFGCNTENPLCTDNYCVEGEIYPRSELVGDFSPIAVDDSVILATFAGVTPATPIETTPEPATNQVSVANIVSDVAINGVDSDYVGQTVTLTATVRFNFVDDGSGAITLVTDNRDISFFVTDYVNPNSLANYAEGSTYEFTLFIEEVAPSNSNPDKTNIWSHEAEE